MSRTLLLILLFSFIANGSALAQTAEVCGNGIDDDADGFSDESCYPGLTNSLVDSPLATRDTGFISPSTGSLYYPLPPDVAPEVPYGPPLAFRRTYASKVDPGASPPAWKKPMGDRWIHNFMGWIQDNDNTLIIRLPSGKEIIAVRTSGCNFDTRAGQATKGLVHCAGGGYTLTMLDGSSLYYAPQVFGGAPMLERITNPGSTFGGSITISYDLGTNQVANVRDGSGNRYLVFGYTGNQLTSIQLQVGGTTQHTTTYSYTGSNLTSVTIGGQLAQTNSYSVSNYLTQIQDGAGNSIVSFAYDGSNPGRAVRVDTTRGMVGFEINSSRANCSGKTVLYFNRGNELSCNIDTDCGATGFLCGGKTGAGSTGQCFRAARCLTVDTTAGHHEDLVTSVSPIGPPGESCEGACVDVSQYLWDNATKYVASLGIQDPGSNYSVREVDTATGLPKRITFGDPDSNATNGNAAREVYLFYGDTNFPGRVTEIRRKSDIATTGCSPTIIDGCQRTRITLDITTGKPSQVQETGFTLNSSGDQTLYNFTTTYSYNSYGQLTQIDGPLPTTDDVTVFEYYPVLGVDPIKEGFLQNFKRKKDASLYVTSSALAFDFWGNATTLQAADGSLTCLTFSAARGHLTQSREAMFGQTDCATTNAADLVTSFARDSALRLTQLTRPDNSCIFYEYDTKGRLLRIKRRDDCNAASAGDKQEFAYDSEGLITEIKTYDSASVLTRTQPFAYFDSRQLQKIINPVDITKWTGLTYDARGLLTQIDSAGGLGKTAFHRDNLSGNLANDGRVTSVDRYKTASVFDTWNLLYDWTGNQTEVKDGDNKATDTVRDDLGRTVKLVSPDMTYPTLFVFDNAGRLVTKVDALGGGADQKMHSFTYDHLGRQLTADYAETNCAVGGEIEIQRAFDALPTGGPPCPTGMTCSRLGGRLAWVEAKLMCTDDQPDHALEQQTFYAYDDAGREIREYIRDDATTPRIADHQYEWTKNGSLSKVTLPSGAVIGATFGVGSNSDSDLVTAIWRTNASTPVADAITYFPFGPLKQYNQQNKIGNKLQRTRITQNLAYRITGMFLEPQSGGAANFSVALAEDAKGRITKRDYSSAATGVQDSFLLYDDQDRVTCENATLVSSCPITGANLKNNQVGGFTNAGDWKKVLRPIPGTNPIGYNNQFNPSGYGTSHQITLVRQDDGTPALGDTNFGYDARGNRSHEDNPGTQTANDTRDYSYDGRRNLISVHGKYSVGVGVWHDYDVVSAFDAQNRRIFKSFKDATTGVQAQWFFYYDAIDRLSEIRYTPNIASSATYSVYQVFWLHDRAVLYWQTDFPAATTTKRYIDTDEMSRPIEMWTWPASGSGTRVWAVNPSAWGFDKNAVGLTVFQPLLFAGQYQDTETVARLNDGSTIHRPGVALNGFRTYDPFTGGYLQVDKLVERTWSSYVYADSDPIGKQDPSGRMIKICRSSSRSVRTPTVLDPETGEILDPGSETIEITEHCTDVAGSGSGGGGFPWPDPGDGGERGGSITKYDPRAGCRRDTEFGAQSCSGVRPPLPRWSLNCLKARQKLSVVKASCDNSMNPSVTDNICLCPLAGDWVKCGDVMSGDQCERVMGGRTSQCHAFDVFQDSVEQECKAPDSP